MLVFSGDEDGKGEALVKRYKASDTRGGDPKELLYSLVPRINNANTVLKLCWESKSYVKCSYLKTIIIHKKRQKGTSQWSSG